MAVSGLAFSRPAAVAREITARLVGPFFGWYLRGPAVRGSDHLAEIQGAFLICPNHSSHMDTSTLRLALGPHFRRRLAIAAAADYFWRTRRLAFVATWLGSFPFNRAGRGGAESIKQIKELIDAGWGVLVYPEGTRSRTGEMGAFHPGVGLIAVQTGCPVVPVRIDGTWQVLPPGARWPRRGQVEVRFGGAMRAAPGEDARAFTARLEATVRAL